MCKEHIKKLMRHIWVPISNLMTNEEEKKAKTRGIRQQADKTVHDMVRTVSISPFLNL